MSYKRNKCCKHCNGTLLYVNSYKFNNVSDIKDSNILRCFNCNFLSEYSGNYETGNNPLFEGFLFEKHSIWKNIMTKGVYVFVINNLNDMSEGAIIFYSKEKPEAPLENKASYKRVIKSMIL